MNRVCRLSQIGSVSSTNGNYCNSLDSGMDEVGWIDTAVSFTSRRLCKVNVCRVHMTFGIMTACVAATACRKPCRKMGNWLTQLVHTAITETLSAVHTPHAVVWLAHQHQTLYRPVTQCAGELNTAA